MIVPEELKAKLRRVYGKLCSSATEAVKAISSFPSHGKVITIGDVVSYNVISTGFEPEIVVYDGLEGREKAKSWMKNFLDAYVGEQKIVKNPPGHITGELWQATFEALRYEGKCKIFVQGEEDLAVIPFVILGSVGDCVMYGVPGEGIDLIVIDDGTKDLFKKLIKDFNYDKESEGKRLKRLKEEKLKEMLKSKRR